MSSAFGVPCGAVLCTVWECSLFDVTCGPNARRYLASGSDIIETNTFSGTRIAMADYKMEHLVRELNIASAKLARAACDKYEALDGRPRFAAGAMGPTNRTASISPSVEDASIRNVTFEELRAAYYEQVRP